MPHVTVCFLDVVKGERIVFTNTLTGGWWPAAKGSKTAIITFKDHSEGTEYSACVHA